MDMRMLIDRMISVRREPNFNCPLPKPLTCEEQEAKIARERRLDTIMRERFPLEGSPSAQEGPVVHPG